MKKLTAITLATSIIIGSAFSSINSSAEAKDDLETIQEQRESIKGNLSEAESQIATIMSEVDDINSEIERVNQVIEENQMLIGQTEQDIASTINEIGNLQDEIIELEADIDKRYEILEDRISSYQKSGGSINYLEVLFGAQSFSDFIGRISMVNTIAESDTFLLEKLESDIQAVEENKLLALEKLDNLNEMKLDQEEALTVIQDKKQQNETSRNSLEKKQRELVALIDELKAEDSSLASLESEVKQSIAASEAEKTSASNSRESGQELVALTGETVTVTSTAYTANCAGCTGVTSTGINLKDNPDTKVIAVDPNVIPLGSVVYVEGYGYGIAGDTGSAIKGHKIDVFVPTREEALKWGVRKVNITIQ